MIRNALQHTENIRNSLVLNYKSAALPLSYAGKMRRTLTHTADWNKLPRL